MPKASGPDPDCLSSDVLKVLKDAHCTLKSLVQATNKIVSIGSMAGSMAGSKQDDKKYTVCTLYNSFMCTAT